MMNNQQPSTPFNTFCGHNTTNNPKSAISVMMITAYIFEQMPLRFEGAMGFHCNR